MEKPELTPELAGRLVATQFPQWAGLPVERVALDGWDNTSFRLGDDLVVRLPSADPYAAQVDKEHRWLPVLAPHLPLPIPDPVARGVPGCGFPRPWSILRWLPGEPATAERVPDPAGLAADLAGFLAALHAVDPEGGPAAGPHSFFRGGPLTVYDGETRAAIVAVGAEVDTGAASEVWEAALAATWRGPPVWVHGDVAPSNLLVLDGRLSGVVDFGCSAVGDPGCDTAIAWTFFAGDSRAAFRERLRVDDATWTRGRGWALWKALVTLVAELDGRPGSESAHVRMGWRVDARGVIEEVLADHAA